MSIDITSLLRAHRFPPSSRYFAVGTSIYTSRDGRQIRYLQRRFVPDPSRFQILLEHLVVDQSERLDNLAAQVLGDPVQFWRICDANGVLQPADLIEVGAVIRITLPEGVTGLNSA